MKTACCALGSALHPINDVLPRQTLVRWIPDSLHCPIVCICTLSFFMELAFANAGTRGDDVAVVLGCIFVTKKLFGALVVECRALRPWHDAASQRVGGHLQHCRRSDCLRCIICLSILPPGLLHLLFPSLCFRLCASVCPCQHARLSLSLSTHLSLYLCVCLCG